VLKNSRGQTIKCKRYWLSFVSSNHIGQGCKKSPFTIYESGHYTLDDPQFKGDDCYRGIYCSIIEALTEQQAWDLVQLYFPDYTTRFIMQVESDWLPPNDRFPHPVKVGNALKQMLK